MIFVDFNCMEHPHTKHVHYYLGGGFSTQAFQIVNKFFIANLWAQQGGIFWSVQNM